MPEDGPVEPPPATQDRGSFTHGVCRVCGWRGPARRSRRVATEDAHTHEATCPGRAETGIPEPEPG